jgi:hypothetical protein
MNTVTVTGPSVTQPYTNIGTSASGQVLTTNGTGGLYWGNLNGTTTSFGQITADPNLKGASIQVKGDAEFDGEVTIKGKKLSDMFEKIEERLAILHPNEKLEEKWDELKELGKRYKELEAEIIEKEKMWAILNK